jgi:hypothetical protein
MRKSLDLCEVRACLRKRSSSLDVAIKQNKFSRAMACGYLGNKLFFYPRGRCVSGKWCMRRISMPRNELEKFDAGNGILQCVGHHAGPQALPQVRQDAEENSIDADHNHHSRALISVGQAKEDS